MAIDPALPVRQNRVVTVLSPRRLGWLVVSAGAVCLVAAAAFAGSDYEIGPGDKLRLVIAGQPDHSGDVEVDADGFILIPKLPDLGKVKASEFTTAELERKLTTLLADGYFKRPQVSVTVADFGSQKVYVAGEVQKPGQYALKADRRLLVLLSDIGPLTPNAGHEVIVVRPPAAGSAAAAPSSDSGESASEGQDADTGASSAEKPPAGERSKGSKKTKSDGKTEPSAPPEAGGGKEQAGKKAKSETRPSEGTAAASAPPAVPVVPGLPSLPPGTEVFHISLLELQSGNPEKNIALQAGDTVYFPRASQVYVMGSVARPGPIRFQEGMTVLQALTQAGGASDRGSSGRTKVIRIVNGKKAEHKAQPTEIVQPEDTLFVPEKFF